MKPSEALERNRLFIRHVVEQNAARNAKVFGSVARGEDTEASDLDLLVEPTDATTLFDLARLQMTLEQHLGVKVDLVTPNGLPGKFRKKVLLEAKEIE